MPLLIWLGMKLSPVWNALGKAASAVLSFVRAKPHLAVIIALVGISGLLWWRLDHVKDERDAARSEITAMIAASKRLIAANERFTKAAKEIAHEADSKDTDLRIVYRDRVMRIPAARGQCPAAQDRTAEVADGPRGDSIVLARPDALICATNTSRLLAAHDWALGIENLQESELPAIY
jgi:hypothetical protein